MHVSCRTVHREYPEEDGKEEREKKIKGLVIESSVTATIMWHSDTAGRENDRKNVFEASFLVFIRKNEITPPLPIPRSGNHSTMKE